MSEHTPGPWHVEPLESETDALAICKAHDGAVATIVPWDTLDETDYANACLIAAAPELLEVLERIANDWEEGKGASHTEFEYRKWARAAIAKARGGS
jgi:hypothetical protein